ncbi:19182_t:CDS:2, partial [Racocetra persica]
SASDTTNNVCNADLHQLLSNIFSKWIIMKKKRKKDSELPFPSSFALLGNLIKYHVKDKQLLIHHPPEYVGPPVQFLCDYHNEDLEMGKEHYQWALKFIHKMANIYPNDESSNDGVLECNFYSFSILCLLAEIKNKIGTAGPWVCVLEAVYVEKPIIDPLTDLISLISTNIRDHAEQIDSKFTKFTMVFPYPNQYKQQDTTIEFTYEKKLRYYERVYELCSEIGKASKLLYISKEVVYSFYIVMIDYVKAKPLYNCNNLLSHDECKTVFEDIEEAISKLHKENIIFAYLCDSNILVNKSQDQYQGMLIDFDWAGEERIECYLSFMNEDINWPPGAEDRKKLSQEHDMYWLKLLKSNYLDESVELE